MFQSLLKKMLIYCLRCAFFYYYCFCIVPIFDENKKIFEAFITITLNELKLISKQIVKCETIVRSKFSICKYDKKIEKCEFILVLGNNNEH